MTMEEWEFDAEIVSGATTTESVERLDALAFHVTIESPGYDDIARHANEKQAAVVRFDNGVTVVVAQWGKNVHIQTYGTTATNVQTLKNGRADLGGKGSYLVVKS